MPLSSHVVIGTDLNRSESAARVGGGEMQGLQAAWTGVASSQSRGIEPAHCQHGDVVGRECRADEAADRFADRLHDFGGT
jgi:hypothetical protein